MSELRADARAFVDARFQGARALPLPGDASTRRFLRLTAGDGRTAILMDYGGPLDGPSADAEAHAIFRAAGLPVPDLLAVDSRAGCLLFEDLGDRMLEHEIAGTPEDGEPPPLLLEAARLAARIAAEGTPALQRSPRAAGPALDAGRFRFEMDFFLENYVRVFRRIPVPTGRSDLRDALHDLADRAARSPRRVLCHRDFHARNLMVAPTGGLAMVDVQDARWGPDSYDVASLIQDPYAALPEPWRRAAFDAFAAASGLRDASTADREHFRARFATVSLQRTIKALGTFGHQLAVRGNDRFATAAPRGLARLRALLAPGGADPRPEDRALRAALDAARVLAERTP